MQENGYIIVYLCKNIQKETPKLKSFGVLQGVTVTLKIFLRCTLRKVAAALYRLNNLLREIQNIFLYI